jgi:hypothetical protein
MKWIPISTALTALKEYHLLKEEQLLIVLKCSLDPQSIRITYEGERHVFLMEPLGYANQIQFKNAYGVNIGKFVHNGRSNTGRIQINDEVFHYNIIDNNQPKLIVHKRSKQQPVAVCNLPLLHGPASLLYEQAGLVLSVCWYATVLASKKV